MGEIRRAVGFGHFGGRPPQSTRRPLAARREGVAAPWRDSPTTRSGVGRGVDEPTGGELGFPKSRHAQVGKPSSPRLRRPSGRCIVEIKPTLPRGGALPFPALEADDIVRLRRAVGRAEMAAAADIPRVLPGIGPSARTALRASCTFAHRAVLLFPTSLDGAMRDFAANGLDASVPIPSVLVRRRLCHRYGLTNEACDISVIRARPSSAGIKLEVFLFPRTAPALEQAIIDAERRFGFEDHLALEVRRPDERTLESLMTILVHDAGLLFEGGGHNPHEGASGSTVLYFVGPTADQTTESRFERFELHCRGDFSAFVQRHLVDDTAVGRLYSDWAGADHDDAEDGCASA